MVLAFISYLTIFDPRNSIMNATMDQDIAYTMMVYVTPSPMLEHGSTPHGVECIMSRLSMIYIDDIDVATSNASHSTRMVHFPMCILTLIKINKLVGEVGSVACVGKCAKSP
jgi:hypothetical protein